MNGSKIALWLAGAALTLLAAGRWMPAQAGEDATITRALSVWVAQGSTFKTGAQEATFVGSLAGPIFVDTEKGLVESGRMICPTIVEIGLDDGKQQARGRCTITARDGALLFAEISCAGVFMVGCKGDIKFTGGTERFDKITGGGKALIRSDVVRFVPVGEHVAAGDGTGILVLTGIHYKMP